MPLKVTVILTGDDEKRALAAMAHEAGQGRKPKVPDIIRAALCDYVQKRFIKYKDIKSKDA